MPDIFVSRAVTRDRTDLVAANAANRDYHAPWARPFVDDDGFDTWFGRLLTGPNIGFVARESESGSIVGVVNISEIVWGAFRSAYLGYYGMAQWRGQGLMTTAVRHVVQEAFSEIGLHRLEANIQPDNVGSIALVRRLGFSKEGYSRHYLKIGGEWRDHERWACLVDSP